MAILGPILTPPGGSTTQLQYNNAGAFGGCSGLTWDGTNLTFATNQELRFRASGNRLYSRTTDVLTLEGNVTTEIGKDGDCVMFGSTLRNFYPSTAGKMQIGLTSNGIAELYLHGEAARSIKQNRRSTSNTAGNTLTVQAAGATSGATDKDGGALILSPGESTGLGKTYINLKNYTQAPSTTTSDNTQIDGGFLGVCKALTEATATTFMTVTVASNTVASGIIFYSIEETNGTDYQTESGMVSYQVRNKAGTIAVTLTKFGNSQTASSGTLTVAFTGTTASSPINIQCNADTSLTPSTGYPRMTFTVLNFGRQAIALA